jgi:hypothetical protein
MHLIRLLTWSLISLILLTSPADCRSGASEEGKRALKVTVSYTGPGDVDQQHQVFVSVFDTSYIGHANTFPLATQALSEKSGTLVFSGLGVSPVYVAAFYDQAGGYDPEVNAPPSGSPAALYGEQLGIADPIEIPEGGTVEISISFDDTIAMP